MCVCVLEAEKNKAQAREACAVTGEALTECMNVVTKPGSIETKTPTGRMRGLGKLMMFESTTSTVRYRAPHGLACICILHLHTCVFGLRILQTKTVKLGLSCVFFFPAATQNRERALIGLG